MQDVLFKTDKPCKTAEPAEYYELSLQTESLNGKEAFTLLERHGWWNSAERSVVTDQEGMLQTVFHTYRDGLRAYIERLNLHVNRGFMHSFIWHPANGAPSYNQKLERR